ncbi:MAG: hypothetical protein ABIM13_06785 [candidate division WOR-3 bacterium]
MKKVKKPMPQIFIIDEWLWSDLNGENGQEKQKEAVDFLEGLYNKCDKIAVARASKFQEKEWDFSKYATSDAVKRGIARFYFKAIHFNSQKYEEIYIEEVEEPDINRLKPDDAYLIKLYRKTKAPIITTDTKLKSILESRNIPCELRDEFLKKYL